jgi:4-hydroxy-tetrahydrodipicolinate reductase
VEESQMAALAAPNFSLGVACFTKLLGQARALFKNYEIAGVEYHHSEKKDAPSGTAKMIARSLGMASPFASVRVGRNPGKHEVIFDSPHDSVTLIHEAHGRESFAAGALTAAHWIIGKKGWLTLDDLLRDLYSTHYSV